MDRNLALEMVRVTEAAALAASRHVGKGNEKQVDQAGVDAMRKSLNSLDFKGRIVIGEGERDEAPMLFIGEEVGTGKGPEVDIAVDPVEGTTISAKGLPNSIAVIAIGEKGNLLNAPDIYMDKVAVGPDGKGVIDITKGATWNLKELARAKDCAVEDLTAVILDRPRHEELIREVRESGARINLIGDGDVSGAIATAREHSGVDILLGIGGAPEGVIAAAALICIGGDIQGRLQPKDGKQIDRAKKMGLDDPSKVLMMDDLAKGDLMFAATGITRGTFLRGVRYIKGGAITESMVMRSKTCTIRFMTTIHRFDRKPNLLKT